MRLEIEADDTPAWEAVIKADRKRLALLEEEKRLTAELEKSGDATANDRLKEASLLLQ